jgi:hypothetical protein
LHNIRRASGVASYKSGTKRKEKKKEKKFWHSHTGLLRQTYAAECTNKSNNTHVVMYEMKDEILEIKETFTSS